METTLNIPLVGIDWGTTHRRAYAITAQGTCTQEMADDQGALASKGKFEAALKQALSALNTDTDCVIMAGMVGSALGWHEVPYADQALALQDLGKHLFAVPANTTANTTAPPRFIVPGYRVRNAWGQPDVMRGEETQLLGAVVQGHSDGWFVLPGTHSKWVELQGGRVHQLRTYMTGELFDLLGRHGTLAAAAGVGAPVWDATAFANGVRVSGQRALSHMLFASRALVVCGDMPAASTRSYLSGLLIGTELKDVMHSQASTGTAALSPSKQRFQLIGSPELARHYQTAADLLSLQFNILDPKAAFVAAVSHLYPHAQKAV
jgi:2-dehydro-3-deoxygalactonokinase